MESRKAEFKDDKMSNKRHRIAGDAIDYAQASFDGLNNDCVLSILSFLPIEDLNTFSMVSHRYRGIRRHESLDQTRIATIVCSRAKQTTSQSLCAALDTAGSVLGSHYTHLKILGLDVLDDSLSDIHDRNDDVLAPIRLPKIGRGSTRIHILTGTATITIF